MGSKEKLIIIINSFILCHFNYCPVIWLFCSNDSKQEMEKNNERALRLALSDYSSAYVKLQNKTKLTTVHIHLIRQLAIQIFTILHNLNPVFMKD